MRPHRLRLSAFGPFPGVVDVDLDQLSTAGLFLLHGPTGAGKTTLLDGMCFALYGRVPGARGVQRLRSDHASEEVPSSATLEFTASGRRLRVTRTPVFTRPKKRGTGVVEEKPTARLEELIGRDWRTLSTRPDEVGSELDCLLGMSAEQFWQVVLLPQGLFAQFLHAGAKERGALLETLFRTDRFRDAESWLGDRRSALRGRYDDAAAEARSLIDRVVEAAQVDEPAGDPDIDWYDEVLAAAQASVTATTSDAVAADAAAMATAERLRAAETLRDRQERRRDAEEAAAALTAAEPEIAAARAAVEAGRRAAPLLPLADHAERVAAALHAALSTADRLAAAVGAQPGDDLAALAGEARARIGRLEGLRATAARLAEADDRLRAADAALSTLDAQWAAVARERDALPARQATAAGRLASAQAAVTALPAARAESAHLDEVAADAAAAAALRTRLKAERRAEKQAREQSLAAREHRLAIAEALLAGQAARLATALVDGEPCAVCGAREHPAPAAASDLVEESALAEAEDRSERAADAHRQAAALLAATTAELATLDARVAGAGWADSAPLADARAAAAARVARLEAAAADLDSAEQAVAALDDADGALRDRLASIAAERAEIDGARAAAADVADEDRAALTEALAGAPDLDAALASTRAVADALDAAHRAAADAARLAHESEAESARVAEALAAAGFGSVADLRATADPALAERVAAHDAAAAALATTLGDPDLDVPLEPAADVASAGEADLLARAARDAARDAAAVATDRLRAVAGHGPALRQALAGLAPLRAELDEVEGLAELAAGRGSGNRLGMALSTFVLAARLEQVADLASQRLARMSDGRYTLRHTDARRDARRRGGLGLVVHDAWTGQSRDTDTLSGGETFMASLALALGLADTVTAEAGGAPIEALFVDEGFGTLDEDSLEEVMDVLDGLRAGGRVVGIVSHVADLRQRIPTQLRVHKGRSGSRLETVA
ncbi:MAG TPA: SMC family ATPase [Mycobacteriales bacterium]